MQLPKVSPIDENSMINITAAEKIMLRQSPILFLILRGIDYKGIRPHIA
jgi:hypothetical protein